MRPWLALWALLACLPAGAQPLGDPGGALVPDPAAPMTIEDARMNFRTVIESFLALNAPQGTWNLKDKRTAKVRRLSLFAIDEKSVKRAGGGDKYKGRVAFREEGVELPVEFEFTVDLGGDSWRVASAKLLRRGAP